MKISINHFLFTAFLGLALITQSCSNSNASASDDATVTADINRFLNQWHKSAATSSHAAYIGSMAKGGVYIGTDASEHWTTQEFSEWSKPYFEQKRGWNLVSLNRHIYLGNDNKTAWFDELLDTSMGLCRGSGVLQLKDGKWKIYQYVLSPTVPNELTNEVKLLKGSQDSLIINKLRYE